ncbi:immunoglobulin V-set domain protein [Dictyocaulus viviparus]|uniref:Immunoglobulin V-set domain protein n=1 Tax=Dictyocaulus viviparus TaxID=29172 RepID=A0A0D8XCD0_DICVI|nr:immunoglobulin V-set domain protein [Dictyocaulus viviparus]
MSVIARQMASSPTSLAFLQYSGLFSLLLLKKGTILASLITTVTTIQNSRNIKEKYLLDLYEFLWNCIKSFLIIFVSSFKIYPAMMIRILDGIWVGLRNLYDLRSVYSKDNIMYSVTSMIHDEAEFVAYTVGSDQLLCFNLQHYANKMLWISLLSYLSHVTNGEQAILEGPQETFVLLGQTAVLKCKVDNQKGAVQWMKNGFGLGVDRQLKFFPRYSMIGSASKGEYNLQITNVTIDDDDVYACQISEVAYESSVISNPAKLTVLSSFQLIEKIV